MALAHLTDTSTYRRLSPLEARMYSGQFRQTILQWIKTHTSAVSKNETKYLRRSLSQCSNPFGAFYLMMKVHKETLSSRAIMSASGSLLFSLGVWVDSKLQPFTCRQQAYFKNSQTLKRQLDATAVPKDSYLFTSDSVSMYTNIPTDHALQLICNHIRTTSHLVPGTPVEAL
jgi:hypothetical protein